MYICNMNLQMAKEGNSHVNSSAEDIIRDKKYNRTHVSLDSKLEVEPTEPPNKDVPADFETAMEVAGFGIFNILLLICAIFASIATLIESSVMSYILPSAECDLKLTLIDKGLLNAITYLGMITSAIIWGYLSDTRGRRNLLIYGYFTNIISQMGSASSQNVIQLMIFKYISGFIACGPFAILLSYLTELHGKKYRSPIVMYIGIMNSIGNMTLPILALAVLPRQWDFEMMGLQFHSWQVFIALSAIPGLLAGILLCFFPESPKFLMSQGRNSEALRVFQRIYAINKHKSCEDFPIKELINELQTCEKPITPVISIATIEGSIAKENPSKFNEPPIKKRKSQVTLSQGWQQIRPLLKKPYLSLSLLVYLMNFAVLFGQNTLRLWVPQMFASIEEYEQLYGTEDATMCAILEYSVNKTKIVKNQVRDLDLMSNCEVVITAASYTNNITVALTSLGAYILAGFIVNRIGSKVLLIFGTWAAGFCAIGLYFSASSLSTSIIASISVAMGSLSSMSILSSSVDLFPTSLRTMVVSLTMMIGRMGSVLGNILFPIFISFGCLSPFLMLTFVMWSAALVSIFIPNTKKMIMK